MSSNAEQLKEIINDTQFVLRITKQNVGSMLLLRSILHGVNNLSARHVCSTREIIDMHILNYPYIVLFCRLLSGIN